ncbi:hypothetical protein LTS18_001648, partial [Coniosporium uncinatum]
FQGRHGTAVTQGIVVASECKEAVESVVDSMNSMQEEDIEAKRSLEALRLWRRFLIGLRIVARVKGYDDDEPMQDVQEDLDEEEKQIMAEAAAGGFLPDEAEIVEPTARVSTAMDTGNLLPDSSFLNGFQSRNDVASGDDPMPERPPRRNGIAESESDQEDSDEFGGGFLPQSPAAAQDASIPPLVLEQRSHDSVEGRELLPEIPPKTQLSCTPELNASHNEKPRLKKELETIVDTTSSHSTTQGISSTIRGIQEQHTTGDSDVFSPTASESEEEHGSLASHDPDDDDAEPEWLAS